MAVPIDDEPRRPHGGRRSKLTVELQEEICELIRTGAFQGQAAQSVGIDQRTFTRWMERGRNERRGKFYRFLRAVEKARAQARVTMERRVFTTDPISWLRLGPGRDRGDGEPGWTESSKVDVKHSGDAAAPMRIEIVWTNDWRPPPAIETASLPAEPPSPPPTPPSQEGTEP